MADTGHTVHIEFPSVFEMIELVQAPPEVIAALG